ncbi:hypothetical protein MPSEU_000891000 [Mayamaea pseudoterrestris]|nr:hypothetical protein MPSEU_000891000 [Mayamaea pseudoterrestris]
MMMQHRSTSPMDGVEKTRNHNSSGTTTDSETDDETVHRRSSEPSGVDSLLYSLVQAYDWPGVLARVTSHPLEASLVGGTQGRTPLHMACEHDAPAVVIQSLLKAHPDASIKTGSSNMTPLHITCSSSDASVHVIRVLLELGSTGQCGLQDLDGDTPLHTACRCGASLDVLEVLVQAYPGAVHQRDYEGLTPLLRLWVRYFVILGNDVIEGVRGPADLVGELGDAWKKTDLLLHAAHFGSLERRYSNASASSNGNSFSLHAAASVDCPRPIVKIAATVYPEQLLQRDEKGRTPLMCAAQAPIYKVQDLSDDGYSLEDVIHGDNASGDDNEDITSDAQQPSIIELLLQACQGEATSAACITDENGRLPLHVALQTGKKWSQGVQALVEAFPDSLGSPMRGNDTTYNGMYPFMLAAQRENADSTTAYEILRHSPAVMASRLLHRCSDVAMAKTPLDVLDMDKGNIN